MKKASHSTSPSPEPISLLLTALPPRELLEVIKADAGVSRVVFQGFSARLPALSQPVVRQRIEREAAKSPQLVEHIHERWLEFFAPLMTCLNDPRFEVSAENLRDLLDAYGAPAMEYAVLHADHDVVRAWATHIAELSTGKKTPTVVTVPPPPPVADLTAIVSDLRARLIDAQQQHHTLAAENDAVQHELNALKQQLQDASAREIELKKQYATAETQLEREQRRARKAEEESERLRKQLRRAQQPDTPVADTALPPDATAAITEAITLLQRTLDTQAGVHATEPQVAAAAPLPPPPPAPPPPREPTFSLPASRGKHTFTASRITNALLHNEENVIAQLRDGLARLSASDSSKERQMLESLVKAGVPKMVLQGTLRAAFVDGSNVANMSNASRGRLAYLQQIRRAAWDEGYFPVVLVVDASLRHRIDQPDALLEMVEHGEIIMAPAGTSADELLIEEAAARNAVIITNDRMSNWPQAANLEKRHIEKHGNNVRLGDFHRNARWFPW